MSELPFAATTPVSVARVGLKARNAAALADFYSAVVGLEQLSRDGETVTYRSLDPYVTREVRLLTENAQTPIIVAPPSAPDFALTRVGLARVPASR